MNDAKKEIVKRFAHDKANSVCTLTDAASAKGFAQALWHTETISETEFIALCELAEKQYLLNRADRAR